MKFEDITRFGSIEETKRNLSQLQMKLQVSASEVPIVVNNDYTGHALRNLVTVSSTLLERLIKYLEEPIEMSAWIARNLFECYLISVYITSDPEKAKEFLVQKASDELEIYEGILTLNRLSQTKSNETPILERMEHIRKTMKMHNLVQAGHWTVGMLGKKTDNKEEYDAFFKLYSKYVHPSSWLINSQLNEVDNSVFRNVFLLQSQLYCSYILNVTSDYKKKIS